MDLDVPTPAAEALLLGRRAVLERYAAWLAGPGVERGLLGPREPARLWTRHLLNCAAVAPLIGADELVVDVGSGAGLPGVVLACLRPDLQLVLVEPMQRRARFLEECVADLGLDSVIVHRSRAEDVAGTVRAATVTARAVAPLPRLVPMTLPLLAPGGQLLAMKGDSAADELAAARPALARWGPQAADVLTCGADVLDPPTTVVRIRLGSAPARKLADRPTGPAAEHRRRRAQR